MLRRAGCWHPGPYHACLCHAGPLRGGCLQPVSVPASRAAAAVVPASHTSGFHKHCCWARVCRVHATGGEGNRQLPQLNQASANATLGSIPGIGMATSAPPVTLTCLSSCLSRPVFLKSGSGDVPAGRGLQGCHSASTRGSAHARVSAGRGRELERMRTQDVASWRLVLWPIPSGHTCCTHPQLHHIRVVI